VATAQQRGCRLADLTPHDFQTAHVHLTDEVYNILGVEKAVAAFKSYGSTAPAEVRKQIDQWKARLAS
ncbi:MAG TPA: argininosuccinate lyase, partial [Pirellulaceae bacterium]|nr:argininosuccinate lyase [Pirellulaceae bacterium]